MPDGFNITIPFINQSFYIYFYGIIIMLGAVAGAWVSTLEAKRRGEDPEIVWDLLVWLIIGGVIGARLWHVFTPSPSSIAAGRTTLFYLTHPFDLINLRLGGLGIPGAVIGGMIALYFFTRKYKMNFLMWTDIAAPAVALGQAVGRWGNYFNQELYGQSTTLPWGISITGQAGKFHPLFFYESIWNLLNLALLLWVGRRYKETLKNGDVFLIYLIFYPIGRFFLDFLRLDAALVGGININQTIMAVVALCASAALIGRHRKK
jgi:phosphatidylglycerol:prolipoprotein diacylglycerol transferase